jgi:2-oxoglutarate dehydrogenase E2 component (dihydrolipoamide succinyltransferase)
MREIASAQTALLAMTTGFREAINMASKIVVPELGESVVEATVSRWLKHEGDHVAVGEAVVEIETEKVNLEVGADQAGVLKHILHQAGDDVKVGEVLAELEPITETEPVAAAEPKREAVSANPIEPRAPTSPDGERVTAVAKRMAADQHIDLSHIQGTGPGQRITKVDVEAYMREREAKTEKPQAPTSVQPTRSSAPLRSAQNESVVFDQPEERIKLSRRRRTIARRLVEAQHTAAMLTTFNEIDLSAVIEIRQRRKETFKEKHGVGLGFMSFFVKASVGALKAFPRVNAELDGDELILKHYYDIGVAVGAEEGLVVPVLRDADRMTFAAIEQRIKTFVQQAQDNTLSIEDLQGGTFTITNGGVFGSMLSTPILNPPQVGILGLHKIEERPIALNGAVVIRPMMYVALSYDHRVVDGHEAVQFLVKVKELIEDPESLLLEG